MSRGGQPSARMQAHRLLLLMLGERLTWDEAVSKAPLVGSDPDQRFTALLALTTLQHLGQIDAVIAQYLDKPLPTKRLAVSTALRMGVTQLLLLDTPAHAAVNESVTLVKQGKDSGLSGLVNAVLQKIAREKPPMPPPMVNLPAWLRDRWEMAYGKQAVATIAQVASQHAPLDVQTTDPTFAGARLDGHTVRLGIDHPPVEALPGYAEGAFFVQDIAASYPVRLLGDVREHQVLDICAAPGGKAMQLIQAGAFVTALDRSSARMRVLKENMARMNMQANAIVSDALAWVPNRAYDAILLDAPCTATGTWRRHPEVVQLVTANAIAEMAALQRQLLVRSWEWLKPGGKLVYCVCSLEPEEGEAQAEWFLTQMPGARISTPATDGDFFPETLSPKGYVRTLPSHRAAQGGMDGFFAVCFAKQ